MESWEKTIIHGVLILSWIIIVWRIFLMFRQWILVNYTTTVPDILDDIYPPESFSNAQNFTMSVLLLSIATEFILCVIYTVFIFFRVPEILWNYSSSLAESSGYPSNELLIHIFFWSFTLFIIYQIVPMPFKLLKKFVEIQYGFNEQTFIGYFLRISVYTLLTFICLVSSFLLFWFWPMTISNSILHLGYFFVAFFALLIIVQIINKYILQRLMILGPPRLLPNGDLKRMINDLAVQLRLPPTLIYTFYHNAFKRDLTIRVKSGGVFSRMSIGINNALLDALSSKEILADLAREFFHCKYCYKELWRIIVFLVHVAFRLPVILLILEYPFSTTADMSHYSRVAVSAIYYGLLCVPFDYILYILEVSYWRYIEYQADAFSVELGLKNDLRSSMIKLYALELAFPLDDWLYSVFINFSRPTLIERLERIS